MPPLKSHFRHSLDLETSSSATRKKFQLKVLPKSGLISILEPGFSNLFIRKRKGAHAPRRRPPPGGAGPSFSFRKSAGAGPARLTCVSRALRRSRASER